MRIEKPINRFVNLRTTRLKRSVHLHNEQTNEGGGGLQARVSPKHFPTEFLHPFEPTTQSLHGVDNDCLSFSQLTYTTSVRTLLVLSK